MLSAQPTIVAHRGSPSKELENTLSSFLQAWAEGADAIEGDFHLTRDKQVVCIHDLTTGRIAHKNRRVATTRLETLQSFKLKGSPAHIPTFSEIAATVPPGKKLFVEIKSHPRIIGPLLDAIDISPLANDQIVIIAFSPRTLRLIKSRRPQLKTLLLAAPRIRGKGSPLQPSSSELLATLRSSQADGISLRSRPIPPAAYLQPILDAGYELHTWTVDTPELAKTWAERGATSITTNFPQLLVDADL